MAGGGGGKPEKTKLIRSVELYYGLHPPAAAPAQRLCCRRAPRRLASGRRGAQRVAACREPGPAPARGLPRDAPARPPHPTGAADGGGAPAAPGDGGRADRKSVVEGKSGSVRVDLGGRRIIKKK